MRLDLLYNQNRDAVHKSVESLHAEVFRPEVFDTAPSIERPRARVQLFNRMAQTDGDACGDDGNSAEEIPRPPGAMGNLKLGYVATTGGQGHFHSRQQIYPSALSSVEKIPRNLKWIRVSRSRSALLVTISYQTCSSYLTQVVKAGRYTPRKLDNGSDCVCGPGVMYVHVYHGTYELRST